MTESNYQLIGEENDYSNRNRRRRRIKLRGIRTIKSFLFYLIILSITGVTLYQLYKSQNKNESQLVLVKGESRKDPYGLELNSYILDGMYCMGYDNKVNKTMEEWSLYTPPCPHLKPVHYPDSIVNPVCEKSSLQIVNFRNKDGTGMPYSLPLNSISNQMKKWKEWEKKNVDNTLYGYEKVENLVKDEYYPFDYGYEGEDKSQMDKIEFYRETINSRMDEVPDPRRRRLFSFILFNSEFDLLDLYITEYYEIIDYFVIYESNSTFNGNPKPLYFTRALLETDRYEKFKDKLIPLPLKIVVDEDNGRVGMNDVGGYQVDYDRDRSIGFLSWFYEYSFLVTQNQKIGTISHPNIAIFDARRSLGQFNERKNRNTPQENNRKRKRDDEGEGEGEGKGKYADPLLDPKFDPYQGYLYTDNTNDLHTGKGFVGEFVRFSTSFINDQLRDREKPTIWSGAWHLSSFFPTINHIMNKVYSYSHLYEFKKEMLETMAKETYNMTMAKINKE
ncbi:glycosyltransferase family 17 protein [Piromyces sp. E2]|nr:glycosyltransferase family 17 protein [Piromyces sp. E2]|eukprot:OUM62901.1 glycosyltransferase family 17 protein [Piromyces sp. E2]